MRPLGWVTSLIGHIGFLIALIVGLPAIRQNIAADSGVTVPVDIVETAPESNVRALSIPQPEAQTTPAAAEEATPEPQPPAPSPTPAPPPPTPPRQQQHHQPAFDVNAVQGLLNRDRQQNQPRNPGAPSTQNRPGAGLGTREVVALQDRVKALVKAEMRRCWTSTVDLPNPERLLVTVQFELDRQGNLRGQPRVTSPTNYAFDPVMRTAVDRALRAVRECDPYTRIANDPVVGSHYEVWGEFEYTFGPERG